MTSTVNSNNIPNQLQEPSMKRDSSDACAQVVCQIAKDLFQVAMWLACGAAIGVLAGYLFSVGAPVLGALTLVTGAAALVVLMDYIVDPKGEL